MLRWYYKSISVQHKTYLHYEQMQLFKLKLVCQGKDVSTVFVVHVFNVPLILHVCIYKSDLALKWQGCWQVLGSESQVLVWVFGTRSWVPCSKYEFLFLKSCPPPRGKKGGWMDGFWVTCPVQGIGVEWGGGTPDKSWVESESSHQRDLSLTWQRVL